jgi:hypothetical protein
LDIHFNVEFQATLEAVSTELFVDVIFSDETKRIGAAHHFT